MGLLFYYVRRRSTGKVSFSEWKVIMWQGLQTHCTKGNALASRSPHPFHWESPNHSDSAPLLSLVPDPILLGHTRCSKCVVLPHLTTVARKTYSMQENVLVTLKAKTDIAGRKQAVIWSRSKLPFKRHLSLVHTLPVKLLLTHCKLLKVAPS